MSDHSFLDLAARAANLSERTRVVAALRAAGTTAAPRVLPRFDTWKIDRLAAKLARRSAPAPNSHARTRDDIAAVLTAYRHHELGLPDASAETRDVFAGVHGSWLPTYQSALSGFDRSDGTAPDASWRRFDVYYGRLAAACEPFLVELGRRLDAARARHPGRFERRLADDIERHLLDRFERSRPTRPYTARVPPPPATPRPATSTSPTSTRRSPTPPPTTASTSGSRSSGAGWPRSRPCSPTSAAS
jgi:hypothetical protein